MAKHEKYHLLIWCAEGGYQKLYARRAISTGEGLVVVFHAFKEHWMIGGIALDGVVLCCLVTAARV